MKIIPPTTRERFLDDLETMSWWRVDLEARTARAELCLHSSVGVSDERVQDLDHEIRVFNRAAEHMMKRWEAKRDGR